MNIRVFAGAFAATLTMSGAVYAQGGSRSSDAASWRQFRLDPRVRVQLDFRNASIDAVLQTFSHASGIAIIKDPGLTGGITLQSPKQQSLSDAFAMLNAVLGLRNYGIQKEGNFLVVRPAQAPQPTRGFGGRGGGTDFSQMGGRGSGGTTTLQVYPIKYANAAQVARVINDVFAVPSGGQTPATPDPNQQNNNNGGNGGRRFGGRFGGRGGFGGGTGTGSGGATGSVKASSDDYSNSVIVNAVQHDQDQVADLIDQIDKRSDQPEQSQVFTLQFANAAEIAPVVQNVLVNNAPKGKGGLGSQNVPFEQRFQQAARFGGSQAAFGTVTVESRTNSLVVTATKENLTLIAQVIAQLDKQVPYVDTSFVYPLQNARADVVAQILNQTYATRGSGNNSNLLGNRTITNSGTVSSNGNRINRTSTGGATSGAPATLGRNQTARTRGASLAAGADASAAIEGAAIDQIGGGFGGGGFGGGGFGGGGGFNRQNQGQNQNQTALDAEGRVVNVRELAGDVNVIPDVNTNSVIVVTSPQNRAIVEGILKQLDQIPQQVMIETMIVEASLDDTQKLGVEWSLGPSSLLGIKNAKQTGSQAFGAQANTAQPQGFRYTLTGPEYTAFLHAVQTDTKFEVLSTPRIFTSNNATAQINISQSIPYVVSQTTDTITSAVLYNYSFLDVGIVLTVTPRITANGYVTMDVTQTANDLVSYTSFNAPIVNQREADTTVSVKDNETIVLGGIIQNTLSKTTNKIPILGDLPVLGKLFQDTNTTKNKTELLVFLTPRIVRDPIEARKLRTDTENQLNPATAKHLGDIGLTNVAPVNVTVGAPAAPPTGTLVIPAAPGAPPVLLPGPAPAIPPASPVATPTSTPGVPPSLPAPTPVTPTKIP
jgi:general secretion pathway protein D